jgi:hypothetical protein
MTVFFSATTFRMTLSFLGDDIQVLGFCGSVDAASVGPDVASRTDFPG